MDLVHNPFLRTISFQLLYMISFDWIIKILSRIASSAIESVMLDLPFHDPSTLAAVNLHALAALFTDCNSALLKQSTRLRFQMKQADTATQTAVRESLSELDMQGRLEFIIAR
jgi:hypothetical protein